MGHCPPGCGTANITARLAIMGNIPVFHEVGTTFNSLGKLVVGDVEGAGEAWVDYSEESVIGSGVRSAVHAIGGDTDEARRIAMGMSPCPFIPPWPSCP